MKCRTENQRKDTSVSIQHTTQSCFMQHSQPGPGKGPTFPPGASLQLDSFCSQKNGAALGSVLNGRAKLLPKL